jgi:outer membrane protein assembly factor BamB
VVLGSAADAVAAAAPEGSAVAVFGDDPALAADLLAKAAPLARHGRITVHPGPAQGRLALDDRLADLVLDPGGVLPEAEALRIARPGAVIVQSGRRRIAPPDPGLADWPQWRCGPGRTGFVDDRHAGLPQMLRWQAGALQNESPMVCGDGALVSLTTASDRTRVQMIVRNPWNGMLRWMTPVNLRRAVKISSGSWRPASDLISLGVVISSGRALVATDESVTAYQLADGAAEPCPALGAGVTELLVTGDRLIAVHAGGLRCTDASGTTLRWEHAGPVRDLCGDGDALFWIDDAATPWTLVSAERATGKIRWRTSLAPWWAPHGLGPKGPVKHGVRLVLAAYGRVVVRSWAGQVAGSAGGFGSTGILVALDQANGQQAWLWQPPKPQPQMVFPRKPGELPSGPIAYPQNIAQVGTDLWVSQARWRFRVDIASGRDTGDVPVSWVVNEDCQEATACPTTIGFKDNSWLDLPGMRSGIEPTGKGLGSGQNASVFRLGNSTCGFATIIAQGLAFFGTKNCACLMGGMHVRAGAPLGELVRDKPARHVGAAAPEAAMLPATDAWPIYLADAQRSGSVAGAVAPDRLAAAWQADVAPPPAGEYVRLVTGGDRLSAPVIAGGLVLTAAFESGVITAHGLADGALRWTHAGGARLDGPPTCTAGLAVYGARDGSVRCLALTDGRLIWRSDIGAGAQRAGSAHRIVGHGAVEAGLPAAASVVIAGDRVIVTTGRLPYDVDGTWTLALDLRTGAEVWRQREPHPPTLPQMTKDGLVAQATPLGIPEYFGNKQSWPLRSVATGAVAEGRAPAAVVQTHDARHALHQFDGAKPGRIADVRAVPAEIADGSRAWAVWNAGGAQVIAYEPAKLGRDSGRAWSQLPKSQVVAACRIPEAARLTALIRAGRILFVGGAAKTGGLLVAIDADRAQVVGQWPLPAAPVFQGLAVADGRVVAVLADGTLATFAPR